MGIPNEENADIQNQQMISELQKVIQQGGESYNTGNFVSQEEMKRRYE
jgi:hypothetical protein